MLEDCAKRLCVAGFCLVLLAVFSVQPSDGQQQTVSPNNVTTRATPRPSVRSNTTRPRRIYNVSDEALKKISARLYSLDVNGAYGRLELDIQNRTNTRNRTDSASRPLFKNGIPADLKSKPTYAKLLALFDNYVAAVNETEVVTSQELAEEVAFLDAVLATRVLQATHEFLIAQKLLLDQRPAAFKEYLRTIWFGLYPRAPGKKGSSGFEHVFLGEWKNGISGLHSWIRYQLEESRGNMNYLGYSKTLPIGQSTVGLIELPMEWKGIFKPVSSMSTSSSPELDMALYTICFLARPNALCPVQGPPRPGSTSASRNSLYRIQTFSNVYQNRSYIGSAYPTF